MSSLTNAIGSFLPGGSDAGGVAVATAAGAAVMVSLMLRRAGNNSAAAASSASATTRTLTWNVAAINSNPFEYWITHDDPAYNKLMADVSAFIKSPGDLVRARHAPHSSPGHCAPLCLPQLTPVSLRRMCRCRRSFPTPCSRN